MKQLLLIIAHKNVSHLEKIIAAFDSSYSFYFIVDKSSELVREMERSKLSSDSRVLKINTAHKINWGSSRIVTAILDALQDVLMNHDFNYAHLISGQDFPTKGASEIAAFMSQNEGSEFIESFSLPTSRWYLGGENRVAYYYLFDWFKARSGILRRINNILVDIQHKLHLKRKFKPDNLQLYGGSMWWTLSKECLTYVTGYVNSHPEILKSMKHSFCSDEILIPTIVMNSAFAEQVINDNLRYICWESRNGNFPANLDESDYDAIVASGKLFARKIEFPTSQKLVSLLSNSIHSKI